MVRHRMSPSSNEKNDAYQTTLKSAANRAGGDEFVRCMHHLFCILWSLKSMPIEWSLSLLCPVLKKCDATICSNYRGISLLTIAYRILSNVLCERLKPFVNKPIGSHQCGFRPGKSTIDQIFTLRQILQICKSTHITSSSTLYKEITYTPSCLSLTFLWN